MRNQEPKEEVQIYTWSDATLREITELVKEVVCMSLLSHHGHLWHMMAACFPNAVCMQVNPAAKRMNARLEFSFVYPDKRGRNVMRVVGPPSLHHTPCICVSSLQRKPAHVHTTLSLCAKSCCFLLRMLLLPAAQLLQQCVVSDYTMAA